MREIFERRFKKRWCRQDWGEYVRGEGRREGGGEEREIAVGPVGQCWRKMLGRDSFSQSGGRNKL